MSQQKTEGNIYILEYFWCNKHYLIITTHEYHDENMALWQSLCWFKPPPIFAIMALATPSMDLRKQWGERLVLVRDI